MFGRQDNNTENDDDVESLLHNTPVPDDAALSDDNQTPPASDAGDEPDTGSNPEPSTNSGETGTDQTPVNLAESPAAEPADVSAPALDSDAAAANAPSFDLLPTATATPSTSGGGYLTAPSTPTLLTDSPQTTTIPEPIIATVPALTPPSQSSSAQDTPASQATATGSDTAQPNGDLLSLKQQALQELTPLLAQLDQTPEEKFRTTMMMIQAADNQSLIPTAYEAAHQITDEKTRGQALLDVVNEINYFTQPPNGTETST